MNEKIFRPGRFRREFLATAIRRYKPPGKRVKVPTVYSWDKLVALATQNNPPPEIIFKSEGKKITIRINKPKRGDKWTYSVIATA